LGDFDTTIPFAIQRMLLATPAYHHFDASGMGNGDDIEDNNVQNDTTIAGRGINTISTTSAMWFVSYHTISSDKN
jgi:hypothetical protein